jgi:hypothetical protein
LSKTARYFNGEGYKYRTSKEGGGSPKRSNCHFTFQNVYDLLTNPSYIGVRRYKSKGEKKQVKAVWEPIIDGETFEKVQALLKENHCRGKPHEKLRYPFMLAGLTYCHECNSRMTGKSAYGNGGKIPYYDHAGQDKRFQCVEQKPKSCFPKRGKLN